MKVNAPFRFLPMNKCPYHSRLASRCSLSKNTHHQMNNSRTWLAFIWSPLSLLISSSCWQILWKKGKYPMVHSCPMVHRCPMVKVLATYQFWLPILLELEDILLFIKNCKHNAGPAMGPEGPRFKCTFKNVPTTL